MRRCPSRRARGRFRLDSVDYLIESDSNHSTLAPKTPTAPADVTLTATTSTLGTDVFTRSDRDISLTSDAKPVRRFRRLVQTMATVIESA